MINSLITDTQADALEEIGCKFCNTKPFTMYVSLDVDSVIDWLRKKYKVVIYNSMEPFVDPKSNKILYRYSVKYCNLRDGWNGRQYIGESTLTANIYSAKKQAIWLAIRWIKKQLAIECIKKQRNGKKKVQTRSTRHSKRKSISTNKA